MAIRPLVSKVTALPAIFFVVDISSRRKDRGEPVFPHSGNTVQSAAPHVGASNCPGWKQEVKTGRQEELKLPAVGKYP